MGECEDVMCLVSDAEMDEETDKLLTKHTESTAACLPSTDQVQYYYGGMAWQAIMFCPCSVFLVFRMPLNRIQPNFTTCPEVSQL